MTEAFEIGVSLALQDGVSDAIGKARRDVAALEHAVRESGVSLRSLREVGVRAASVAFGDQRREVVAGPVKPVVQPVAPRLEAEAAPRFEAGPPARMEVPAHVETADLPRVEAVAPLPLETEVAPWLDKASATRAEADGPPRVETEAKLPLVRDAGVSAGPAMLVGAVASAPVAAGVQEMSAPVAPRDNEPLARRMTEAWPSAPAALAEPLASSAAAVVPAAPQGQPDALGQASAPMADIVGATFAAEAAVGVTAPVAPLAPLQRDIAVEPQTRLDDMQWPVPPVAPATLQAARAEVVPLADQMAAVRGDDERQTARPMTLLSALRLSGGSAPIVQSEDNSAATVDSDSGDYGGAGGETVQPSPAFLAAAPSSAPPADVAAPRGTEKGVPQQAEQRDAGRNEGDVFLDGMLVGRWMSRFLNREAERASAGPTGFDARRGRLLPGVTVGG